MKTKLKGWAIKSPHIDGVLLHTVDPSGEEAWRKLVREDSREERENRVKVGYKAVKVTVTEGWEE